MRIIPCPIEGHDQDHDDGRPVYYITLPDVWLGKHAMQRQIVRDSIPKGHEVFENFYVALALCDDWHLPDIPNNKEQWDLENTDARIIFWVGSTWFTDYMKVFQVKKKTYNQSVNGTSQAVPSP